MKLGSTTVVPVTANTPRADKSAPSADVQSDASSSAASASSSATPSVSVTQGASSLLQPGASTGSVVDQTKVDSMRAAIADGSYQVNAGAIADKMLANAEEILRRQAK